MRRKLIGCLFGFILTFCLIEGLLRTFDPLRIELVRSDWHEIAPVPGEQGILVIDPGVYRLTENTVTIGADGFRVLPDTNLDAACTIAFIGDSVTFGWGVDDHEVFANRIAREFPNVRFINASAPGSDNLQLLWMMEHTAANGYIHLIYENDARDIALKNTAPRVQITAADRLLYTRWYIKRLYSVYSRAPEVINTADFFAALDGMRDYNVLFFAQRSNPLIDRITERYPEVVVLDWTWRQLNWADSHPDPAGHEAGARLMLPYVREFVQETCGS